MQHSFCLKDCVMFIDCKNMFNDDISKVSQEKYSVYWYKSFPSISTVGSDFAKMYNCFNQWNKNIR